jgi:hypothetical protein
MIQDFTNYGYIFEENVPMDVFNSVRDTCYKAKNIGVKYNNSLVGQLKEEYQIDLETCPENIKTYILKAVKDYCQAHPHYLFNYRFNDKDKYINLNSIWCNFQRKGEFNPLHNHSGLFSFVFWVDIPYNVEEEKNLDMSKDSSFPMGGSFSFHYLDTLGRTTYHKIDPKPGNFALFPAQLDHSVAPFYTSDEYRVSMSGNLCYIT